MEAATLAWAPLGWKCAFLSEIDKAPSALLEQRFPDVPNFGDMTKFEEWPDVAIDLLAGGTPCQSFSNAGLRRGLSDPRGSLMFTYGAIAQRYRPTWIFWENVPGVLSSNDGRDFGASNQPIRVLAFDMPVGADVALQKVACSSLSADANVSTPEASEESTS